MALWRRLRVRRRVAASSEPSRALPGSPVSGSVPTFQEGDISLNRSRRHATVGSGDVRFYIRFQVLNPHTVLYEDLVADAHGVQKSRLDAISSRFTCRISAGPRRSPLEHLQTPCGYAREGYRHHVSTHNTNKICCSYMSNTLRTLLMLPWRNAITHVMEYTTLYWNSRGASCTWLQYCTC